jgi:hypothetical protein
MAWLAAAALLSSARAVPAQRAALATPVRAAVLPDDALEGTLAERPEPARDDAQRGPVVPAALARNPSTFWSVGLGLERFGTGYQNTNDLLGIAAMFRMRSFGPHAVLMAKPNPDSYQDARFLAGLGLRGYFPLLGVSFSYGVGLHAEVRLEDHFWLAYATPLELGVVVYAKHSWDIEVFAGARRAFAGSLINHFLIDPNGFDNQGAQEELDRIKTVDPWRGFIRVVFARRID